MLRCILVWLCFCFSLFNDEPEIQASDPDQIATLTSTPNSLIGGLINPLSGQLSLSNTDLIIKGAQDILLRRIYIPPYMPSHFPKHKDCQKEYNQKYLQNLLTKTYKGWQFLPHLKLQLNPKTMDIVVTDPNAISLEFHISGTKASLKSGSYALSNCLDDTPSAKYDPRNTQIFYKNNKITVQAPDGTKRFYYKKDSDKKYLLHKEILPNGKVLRYSYQNSTPVLIESLDPNEHFVYASLAISGTPQKENILFTSSSEQTVEYTYQKIVKSYYIKEKHHEESGYLHYPPILTSVSSPFYLEETINYSDNFLLTDYCSKEHTFKTLHASFGKDPHYRVHKLCLPVGTNDDFTSVYEITYDPPIPGEKEGITQVKASDETTTIYHFSKNLLLTSIQFFDKDILKKEKIFSWYDNNWLKSIEIKGHYKKSFTYDNFGNPITETITGNLTGDSTSTYTIQRQFSEDGLNLLKEEYENGKVICFSYLPGTNLITSKLIKDHDQIILRDVFIYDDCNNLISKISDDGSDTTRRITNYKLRNTNPFLHMPEWIEEKYLENSEEKLLKSTHISYDLFGNISKEDIYDANNNLAYTIYKKYNEKGELISETNPLGQKATYTYTTKGKLETSTNFSNRLQKNYTYDKNSRLRILQESGEDDILHITTFDYDLQDRLIKKTDHFGNPTYYSYDPVVNKVSSTQFLNTSTSCKYDVLGNPISKTDANGNLTTHLYNAYGSPIEINYPDGSKEYFRYEKSGILKSYTDRSGLHIDYTTDILGRILTKNYEANCKSISTETFTFNSFNLLSETNKEGYTTHYTYDGAGRKIKEDYCGHIIKYTYNPLGELETICKNDLLTLFKRDLEGRILEEIKADLIKTSYTYDEDGYINTITKGNSTESFKYDSLGRQIEHKDANSNITKTFYDETKGFLSIETFDPQGNLTIETKDPFDRLVKFEKLSKNQIPLSSQEFQYDPQGNLIYEIDNGKTTKYTYTVNNQLKTKKTHSRLTSYTYYPSGKIKTKTLPDYTKLTYNYDSLGFLNRIDSSDHKIHHSFKYNLLGYLTFALDENSKTFIQRQIDPFGNILQENFSTGLYIKKEYDKNNRPTLIESLFGKIIYTYDPLFLRGVSRLSKDGTTLYTHTYNEYDQKGCLISENLIGDLGQTTYNLDPKGQKTSITNPYLNQEYEYDSIGNLIYSNIDNTENHFSYDGLYQLTKENNSTYSYDPLYNRIQKNNTSYQVNALNELINFTYDLNGNQTQNEKATFIFDPLNRLIQATTPTDTITFTYDPLGRCLTKTSKKSSEFYLYDNQKEIGAFTSNLEPKNLLVLGFTAPIAIENDSQIFAPIFDPQKNIRCLIDIETQNPQIYYPTAFGENTSTIIPWAFASKRLHPELNLIYFGQRFYDPTLGRWLSPDPLDNLDSPNLYQYNFNNPLCYFDPNGENIFGLLCGIAQIIAGGALVVSGGMLELATFGGYTFALGFHEAAGLTLITSGIATTTYNAKDLHYPITIPKAPEWNILNYSSMADKTLPTSFNDKNNNRTSSQNDKEEKKSPGNLQKQVEQGKAPKTVDRIDKGRGGFEKDHIHFKDGSTLNSDGTWKHGGRELTRQEFDWLQKNGWNGGL